MRGDTATQAYWKTGIAGGVGCDGTNKFPHTEIGEVSGASQIVEYLVGMYPVIAAGRVGSCVIARGVDRILNIRFRSPVAPLEANDFLPLIITAGSPSRGIAKAGTARLPASNTAPKLHNVRLDMKTSSKFGVQISLKQCTGDVR